MLPPSWLSGGSCKLKVCTFQCYPQSASLPGKVPAGKGLSPAGKDGVLSPGCKRQAILLVNNLLSQLEDEEQQAQHSEHSRCAKAHVGRGVNHILLGNTAAKIRITPAAPGH